MSINETKRANLINDLSNYGHVRVLKADEVVTLFITGKKLDSSRAQAKIMEFTTETYPEFPIIEVLVTETSFYLMVLKKKKK